jgi:ribosomal protein S18 acetylase RimI-like enzyme
MRRARAEPTEQDREVVRAIVCSTGFFSPEEVDIAVELVDEALARGEASGYHFVFLESAGEMLGYACFGPIPATEASWDLYWIAVHERCRGAGHGRWLLREAERAIAARGGRRVWIDTSSRAQYASTRAFYERCGYARAALLEDFYRPGDGKVIYCRAL